MAKQNKGQRQQKKKTAKARKLDHKSYVVRECRPGVVLRRIIQSSGKAAAEEYAQKYGLTSALRYLEVAEPAKQPRLVGRALRRHMKKLSLLAQAKKTAQAQ